MRNTLVEFTIRDDVFVHCAIILQGIGGERRNIEAKKIHTMMQDSIAATFPIDISQEIIGSVVLTPTNLKQVRSSAPANGVEVPTVSTASGGQPSSVANGTAPQVETPVVDDAGSDDVGPGGLKRRLFGDVEAEERKNQMDQDLEDVSVTAEVVAAS